MCFSCINVFICLTKVPYLMVILISLTTSLITQLEIQTSLLCQGHITNNLREVLSYSGTQIWNNLDIEIRNCSNLNIFKRMVKANL